MTDTEKRGGLKGVLSNIFLVLNILLLGVLLYQAPSACQDEAETSKTSVAKDTGESKAARSRNPAAHLPLKGMVDFDGDDTDACLRMEGFLLDMDYELAKADLNLRVPIQGALVMIKEGHCAITVPEIQTALAALNKARVAVGLPSLPSENSP